MTPRAELPPAPAPSGDVLHGTVTGIAAALGIGRQCAQAWKRAMGLGEGPYSELGWRLWARRQRTAAGGKGYECPAEPTPAIAALLDPAPVRVVSPQKDRADELTVMRQELALARELGVLVTRDDVDRVIDAFAAVAAAAYIDLPDQVLKRIYPSAPAGELAAAAPAPLTAGAARLELEQLVRDARQRLASEARRRGASRRSCT
jgi:hypothetical protein